MVRFHEKCASGAPVGVANRAVQAGYVEGVRAAFDPEI
jgi:hypothetical protein